MKLLVRKIGSNSGWNTRRLYRYEFDYIHIRSPEIHMRTLRALGRRIWVGERRSLDLMPSIVAGDGIQVEGYHAASFYDTTFNRIVLARHHRTRTILAHEMTHALGYDNHDERFIRKYFALLANYCNFSAAGLVSGAEYYGIQL